MTESSLWWSVQVAAATIYYLSMPVLLIALAVHLRSRRHSELGDSNRLAILILATAGFGLLAVQVGALVFEISDFPSSLVALAPVAVRAVAFALFVAVGIVLLVHARSSPSTRK
jgi:hypothetical protein